MPRLGNMGWFSSKKEHQEILTQIQNSAVKENQKEDQNITCNPKIIIRIDEFEDDEKVTVNSFHNFITYFHV